MVIEEREAILHTHTILIKVFYSVDQIPLMAHVVNSEGCAHF